MAPQFLPKKLRDFLTARAGYGLILAALVGCGVSLLLVFVPQLQASLPILMGVLSFGLCFLFLKVLGASSQKAGQDNPAQDLMAFEHSVRDQLERHRQALQDQQQGVSDRLARMAQTGDAYRAKTNTTLEDLAARVDALQGKMAQIDKQLNPGSVPIPAEDAVAAQVPPMAVVPKPETPISVKSVVSNDGLSMHLQPIVDISARKPVLYEAFMRVRSARGQFLEQDQFQKMAVQGGLMPTIDKKVLFSSLRMLRRLGEKQMRAGVLCQIASQSLADTKGFQEIAALLKAYSHMNDLIVIEVNQRAFSALKDRERERLSLIADIGFPLSLGKTNDVSFDAMQLYDRGFRYVRSPASILLHADIDDGGGHTSRAEFASALEAAGITLIADEVEREQDALRLIDLNVFYGQGALFAPPRPVKPELLQAPSFEPATAPATASG